MAAATFAENTAVAPPVSPFVPWPRSAPSTASVAWFTPGRRVQPDGMVYVPVEAAAKLPMR